jgi:hypothetical protein
VTNMERTLPADSRVARALWIRFNEGLREC